MDIINKIIKKIEIKFKLDLRYIIKNFTFVGGEQFVSTVFGLLTIYAIGNFLTPTLAGEYKYITSLAGIISSFTLTGMMYGVTREVALGNHSILSHAYVKNLKHSLIPIGVSIVIGGYYFYKFNLEYAFAVFLATVFTTLTNVFFIYKSYLTGNENFKLASKLTVYSNLVISVTSFIGFYYFTNLNLIIFSSLGVQMIISYLIYKNISKLKSFNQVLTSEVKYRYNSYVMHQSLLNIFTLGVSNIDKVLMFQFLGPKDLAIYSITTVLIDRIRGILKSAGTIAYPKFVKHDMLSIKKGLNKQLLGFTGVIFIFFIATVLMIPTIYKYILPQYAEYSNYAMIYSISLFSVLVVIPYTILQAKNMSKYLYQYESINNTVQIALVLIGMYYFGLSGAIIARAIGSVINTLMIYTFIKRIPS